MAVGRGGGWQRGGGWRWGLTTSRLGWAIKISTRAGLGNGAKCCMYMDLFRGLREFFSVRQAGRLLNVAPVTGCLCVCVAISTTIIMHSPWPRQHSPAKRKCQYEYRWYSRAAQNKAPHMSCLDSCVVAGAAPKVGGRDKAGKAWHGMACSGRIMDGGASRLGGSWDLRHGQDGQCQSHRQKLTRFLPVHIHLLHSNCRLAVGNRRATRNTSQARAHGSASRGTCRHGG